MAAPLAKLDNAISTFMFANDPRFLFTRLRKDASVQAVAERLTPAEIIDWLNVNAATTPSTVENLVIVFIHIVALALHDRKMVLSALAKLRMDDIPWSSALLSHVCDSLRATKYTAIPYDARCHSAERYTSTATSSSTNITVKSDTCPMR